METAINMDTPIKESSYLSLYVTIEPQLLVPDAYRESVRNLIIKIQIYNKVLSKLALI
jgi:hypothetical protein